MRRSLYHHNRPRCASCGMPADVQHDSDSPFFCALCYVTKRPTRRRSPAIGLIVCAALVLLVAAVAYGYPLYAAGLSA